VLGPGEPFRPAGPGGAEWKGAPSAQELASRLSKEFHLPSELAGSYELLAVRPMDLGHEGRSTPLYEELHDIFDRDLPTTPLHHFLAEIPANCGRKASWVTRHY